MAYIARIPCTVGACCLFTCLTTHQCLTAIAIVVPTFRTFESIKAIRAVHFTPTVATGHKGNTIVTCLTIAGRTIAFSNIYPVFKFIALSTPTLTIQTHSAIHATRMCGNETMIHVLKRGMHHLFAALELFAFLFTDNG
jgi:hypothetical protein